ncbi:5'-nucleotidase [Lactobacillus johnsonii]|uniref:5'-nucleotidase n=1 Tax=Lactobacillus johnsonii TaxID=33959 RepID=UPI001CBD5389|nr:5'-nucleotidase [Lactobacillus johnsonii]MBZ4027221.1 5'-nucleotidase [Lactobacillus johnsonii]
MKLTRVITTVGVVGLGVCALGLSATRASAAQVSRVEVKSVAGSWQNTILGPAQNYIGGGGGYSRGPNPQYGSWRHP